MAASGVIAILFPVTPLTFFIVDTKNIPQVLSAGNSRCQSGFCYAAYCRTRLRFIVAALSRLKRRSRQLDCSPLSHSTGFKQERVKPQPQHAARCHIYSHSSSLRIDPSTTKDLLSGPIFHFINPDLLLCSLYSSL